LKRAGVFDFLFIFVIKKLIMKTSLKFSVLFLVLTTVVSCKDSESRLLSKINDLENAMAADTLQMPSPEKATALIDAYESFATQYPEHEQTPEFLFKAGRYAMSYNFTQRAIGFFDKIIADHPEFDKHADSYFLKAFVYDSQLGNIPKARVSYQAMIDAYPDHELATEAAFLIEILGKPLEEIIAGFEKMNSEQNQVETAQTD